MEHSSVYRLSVISVSRIRPGKLGLSGSLQTKTTDTQSAYIRFGTVAKRMYAGCVSVREGQTFYFDVVCKKDLPSI